MTTTRKKAPTRKKAGRSGPKPSGKAGEAGPFKARMARVSAAAGEAGADRFLVTNPVDVGYLTGFLGGDSYLLLGGSGPVMISDFRYQEELEHFSGLASIHIRKGPMVKAVAELLGGGFEGLGIQAEHMTVAERDELAKQVGARRVRPTRGILSGLRARKDEQEIKAISKAIKVQERALLEVLPTIEPGQTEAQVAARIEAQMKSRGASGAGFSTIVAARANGSLPHYRPADVKIAKNQPLLIDWGATVGGYNGDMTRTFALGRWPAKIKEIYQIVLDAHLAAAEALAPGRTTREVDAVARDHIKRHGYGDRFGHGLGHGLGMNVHEEPRLNPLYDERELEPGNVVTIEPGIYLPGVGGVRIEDDFAVTDRGSKNLSSLPKDLEWSTLA